MNLSCDETEFIKAKSLYEKKSAFNYNMKFEAPVENTKPGRNRKVTWFNSSYSLDVETNISKVFLKLVTKHFPRLHKLNKIFKINTNKIDYRSVPNLNNLVTQHNSKISSNDQDKIQRSCNSRIEKRCPLNGKCLQQYMIYKAEVTTNNTYKGYYETSEDNLKSR